MDISKIKLTEHYEGDNPLHTKDDLIESREHFEGDNPLRRFLWRVRDEILHRKKNNVNGGRFNQKDWITEESDEALSLLDFHITQTLIIISSDGDT